MIQSLKIRNNLLNGSRHCNAVSAINLPGTYLERT
jgi:hypothetical protein